MNIVTIQGGCSSRRKPVGFQFSAGSGKYYICGSFSVTGGLAGGREETLNGEFHYGQYKRGCKMCGNKYVYQCGHCSSFNCYDGNEQAGAECPVCGKKTNIPATTDDRIVRSSAAPSVEIILAVDTSGSMSDIVYGSTTRLDEMKRSAIDNFISQFEGVKMALVAFRGSVSTVLPFTEDTEQMKSAVRSLTAYGGTTSPFAHIRDNYPAFCTPQSGTKRYIVVFTDGEWSGESSGHVTTANKLKANGVSIITIGCAGADKNFLRSIASEGANIDVVGNDFGSAYATAAKQISQ